MNEFDSLMARVELRAAAAEALTEGERKGAKRFAKIFRHRGLSPGDAQLRAEKLVRSLRSSKNEIVDL